tara:strand:- start:226 stop:540 length:315 start_codon:yes stop_codon:yes gene_type:complete
MSRIGTLNSCKREQNHRLTSYFGKQLQPRFTCYKVIATITTPPPASNIANGTQHPMALPTFRCLPERVKGIPIFLLNLPFAAEIPSARFQLKLTPNFLPICSLP